MAELIGKTILHYEIIKQIGQGGMGVVYLAQDVKLGREVAIKFLPRNIAGNQAQRERFKIEAKAAAALNHPNIAHIYAIEEAEDEIFIVMEYIDGRQLKKVIETPESDALRLNPINEIIAYILQILSGLQAAHAKGIIHRDIKSDNVMLNNLGQIKIMDFGLAKFRGSAQVTQEGTTLGTIAYMSPEQARGNEVDTRSDIWSAGVIFYELLTGRQPFRADYEQAVIYSILNDKPESLQSLRPEIPQDLAEIVEKCLQKDRNLRYQRVEDVISDLKKITAASDKDAPIGVSFKKLIKMPHFYIPAAVITAIIVVAAIWWMNYLERVNWARTTLLPQIEQIAEQAPWTGEGPETWQSFQLALTALPYISDDPQFNKVLNRISRKIKIYSTPAGAQVYARPYSDIDAEWTFMGQSQLDSTRFPRGFSRIKLVKQGYADMFDLIWNAGFLNDTMRYQMSPEGSLPEDMVLIPEQSNWFHIKGAPAVLHLPGLEEVESVHIGDFLMDRFEVTNRAYKKFIDAGGYEQKKYWKHAFIKDGKQLSWQEATANFIDRTGRPGPSTWEVGDFPDGKDDFPVTGVSWYEAAAYAEFAGKSLPTIYHWDRTALTWASPLIVPISNMINGTDALKVGMSNSMNRFGVFDLAGNVREWCFNLSSRGDRFILGGGWNDPAYAFNDAFAQSAFDRSPTNGFRCVKYDMTEDQRKALEATIYLPFRDFYNEPRISEQTFALYLKQFTYDKTPLDPVTESRTEHEDWICEKITFNAAYGNERMIVYLYLPRNIEPPYQTVVYFPGSGSIHTRTSEAGDLIGNRSYILKSGRAFMFPVYKSTYERGDDLQSDYPNESNFWKEHIIMWGKDLSRSLDYLETRADIDKNKFAYYGVSWGAAMASIMLAVENRFDTSVLVVAGLNFQRALPEVDEIHYISRIKTPVLMLNGKYDFFFPYETSQLPFFDLLSTPQADKKMFIYDRGHSVPTDQLVKESLDWLDKYLGPVN